MKQLAERLLVQEPQHKQERKQESLLSPIPLPEKGPN